MPVVPRDPVKMRRATAGGFLRSVYALAVFGLAAFLGWQVLKPVIYTQSPGTVTAPAYVVSTPFAARVLSIAVEPGTRVKKGAVVATVRSPEIYALRASLLHGMVEQANKEADLRVKLTVARHSIDAAQNRLEHANKNVQLMEKTPAAVSTGFRIEVFREQAVAALGLAQLEAEITEISIQLGRMHGQLLELEKNRQEVETAFNEGRQLSPVAGVVGPRIAEPGQSVSTGHSIVQIYDDSKMYVEWILSAGRIRQPEPGARVYVIDGTRVMRGRIEKLQEIAEKAEVGPSLFGRAEAGQLVRIKLDAGERYPPLLTTIEVRYNYWRFMDPAVELFVEIMAWLGVWREA